MTSMSENKIKVITFVILLGTSLFAMIDVLLDLKEGVEMEHMIHEVALWAFSMAGAFYQFKIINWQKDTILGYRNRIDELDTSNIALKAEQENFKKKISHLSSEFLISIDDQFKKWGFSRAEKEIALLLIKGLAMKEIAEIRGSTENTVRQQASQIYKKSSLNGRMELSAFFLDDLLALSKLPDE